jgi:hypothetical protein
MQIIIITFPEKILTSFFVCILSFPIGLEKIPISPRSPKSFSVMLKYTKPQIKETNTMDPSKL